MATHIATMIVASNTISKNLQVRRRFSISHADTRFVLSTCTSCMHEVLVLHHPPARPPLSIAHMRMRNMAVQTITQYKVSVRPFWSVPLQWRQPLQREVWFVL